MISFSYVSFEYVCLYVYTWSHILGCGKLGVVVGMSEFLLHQTLHEYNLTVVSESILPKMVIAYVLEIVDSVSSWP